MTKKRCTDCKHTKGIGHDFWCGEGHTEYEVFIGETNCPYFEYHDWSKGTPSRTEKRFTHRKWYNERQLFDGEEPFAIVDIYIQSDKICNKLNEIAEENEQLKMGINSLKLLVQTRD